MRTVLKIFQLFSAFARKKFRITEKVRIIDYTSRIPNFGVSMAILNITDFFVGGAS